jgi:protein gp37
LSDNSGIEWTDATWNPVTGCSKVSPGCAHCYAETLSLRYGWSRLPWTPQNAVQNVLLHPERLEQPLRWTRPRMIFVNSMSDLFHELVPFEYVDRVWDIMAAAPQHIFQVLTKRPERMARYTADRCRTVEPLANVWLGTSIENDRWVHRADALRSAGAAIRFLSLEPLLGPLPSLELDGIGWIIVGGESGADHRPIDRQWVRDLRDRASDAGVAFFFKQWGGRTPKAGGRELDGRTWDEMPLTRLVVPDGDAELRQFRLALDRVPGQGSRERGHEIESGSRLSIAVKP